MFAAVIYCLFASGIVFGYAALKPVLKREGAYADACQSPDPTLYNTCVEIRLNLMFTVAAVGTNVAALPIGAILDHYGPRVCGLIGSTLLASGSLLLAYAKRMPFDGFLIGYLMLALGGPFIYISSFQLSNAFPQHSGLILALITGAFDASSALFLVYRIIYQSTDGAFGHHRFFLFFLVVPASIALVQLLLQPKQSYKTVGAMIEEIGHPDSPPDRAADQVDEQTALLHDEIQHRREEIEEVLDTADVTNRAKRSERKNEISGVWGIMHANTAAEQIRSPWFVLICLFTGTYRPSSTPRDQPPAEEPKVLDWQL